MKIKKLLFLIVVLISPLAWANNILQNHPYPGGIAVIPLKINSAVEPKVFYQQQRTLVLKENNQWQAIVGISLETKPGTEYIFINSGNNSDNKRAFIIIDKKYPLRHITIKDKSKVTPDPKLAKLIQQQTKQMDQLLAQWNYQDDVSTQFILPVQGRLSSGFGIRRIYNHTLHTRHTAQDIAAPVGTPIVAAAKGTVLAVEDYVLTGNTVFVDHGQGLITFYCHMNSVAVKPGDKVTQGETLGTVGATGRVTGPHVHWGVVLNSVKVDPMLLVEALRKTQ